MPTGMEAAVGEGRVLPQVGHTNRGVHGRERTDEDADHREPLRRRVAEVPALERAHDGTGHCAWIVRSSGTRPPCR